VAGTCEYGKELSGSIKVRGISLLAANTGQLLKKDSAPWSKYSTLYIYSLFSLSFVLMKVRNSFLVWVRGQRKMSQVLGAFGLLDFTMLWLVLVWRAF
jgi:hypothetical protein